MRGIHLFLVCVALLAAPVSASAADMRMPVKAAPYAAPVMNWSGWYAGLGIGYHHGNITQSGCVGFCPVDPTLKGAFLVAQGGYDWHLSNNYVVGLFAQVPLTRFSSTVPVPPLLPWHVEPQYTALLNGRVGHAMGMWLPYVFGGLAISNVDVRNDNSGLTTNKTYVGFDVGVGLEYALTRNWTIDGKYAFIHMPKKTYDFGGGPENFGENSHNVFLSVNYRFGGPVVAKY